MKITLDRKFFTGGNATFTVDNGKGTHYTFKIKHKWSERKEPNAPLFASLLTGPDNENSYTYLGMVVEHPIMTEVEENGAKVMKPTGQTYLICRMTKSSKMNTESTPVKVLNWVLYLVSLDKELPEGYKVHHEGHCGCCGRTLTVPESIERGIGPECWSRMGGM